MKLSNDDLELIEIARDVVKNNCNIYDSIDLHIGCAVRAKSGKIYKGINICTSHSICAEQVALGQALAMGEREIDCIVSVKMNKDGKTRVVSPCGLCRYTFEKLNLDCDIIVEDISTSNVLKVNSSTLLPYPYKRESKVNK